MAGNDYNAYEGDGEAPQAVMRKRPGVGETDPNRYTSWDDGTGPRDKGRPMDEALRRLPEEACSKCSFKTRIHDDYVRHMKVLGGKILCERQQANFAGVETCGACSGSGESANGTPCGSCKGMGRTLKASGAVAAGASKEEIVQAVVDVLDKKFDKLIGAIQGLVGAGRAEKASAKAEKKTRGKYRVRGSSSVRKGAPPAGPGPSPIVESVAEKVADSPGEPGEAQ